mgnify:FL=1
MPGGGVTPMDFNFFMESDVLRYQGALRSWVSQVSGAAAPTRAVDAARFAPSPPALIRGVSALYRRDLTRAEQEVDAALYRKLSAMKPGPERDQCVKRMMPLTWARRSHQWARTIQAEDRRPTLRQ